MPAPLKKPRPSVKLRPTTVGKGNAANHSSIRESNLALVASQILSSGGGMSRADLAEATGLTKATVSRLVKELMAERIIVEGQRTKNSNIGRPGTPLYPAGRTLIGVGIEVNTDLIAGAALDLTGTLVDSFQIEGDFSGLPAEDTLALAADATGKLLKRIRENSDAEVTGVSLGIPGLVDTEHRGVTYAPNLGWWDVHPADAFAKVLDGIPFSVDNDANLQATAVAAEGWALPDPFPNSFLYLTGDMGIGGSLMREGIIDRGPHGWAGEIGHTVIEPGGPVCHCGSQGCLERYAGKRAISRAAGISRDGDSKELLSRLKAEDPVTMEAVERAGWALGIALSNAVNLLDIDTVVLGTSLAPLLPWLEPTMRQQLDLRVLGGRGRDVKTLAAPLQEMSAPIGGAIYALQSALEQQL